MTAFPDVVDRAEHHPVFGPFSCRSSRDAIALLDWFNYRTILLINVGTLNGPMTERPMFSTRRIVLASALTTLAAAPLIAATAKDVVATRVAGFRSLGAAFKNVNDELKSGTPQPMILQLSARQIRDAAQQQYKWFPAGSGPQAGIKTAAKPEIWTQAAQFKAAQDAFATQANAFARGAGSGNATAIRVAAKQLGGTCATCHRSFRVEER